MKHAHQTWYRLVDGTQADPNDVVTDEKGVLKHKNGVAVALRDSGDPLTVGARDVVDNGNVAAAEATRLAAEAKAKADADAESERIAAEADAKAKADAEAAAVAEAKDREMKSEGGSKKYKTR